LAAISSSVFIVVSFPWVSLNLADWALDGVAFAKMFEMSGRLQ